MTLPEIHIIPEAKIAETTAIIRSRLAAHNRGVSDIKSREEIVLTAVDEDEELAGGITASLWGRRLEIHFLWISETVRGEGLGSRLLHRMEEVAREKGCKKILLDTFSFQAPLFYEKAGYVELCRVDGYSSGKMDRIFFEKEL